MSHYNNILLFQYFELLKNKKYQSEKNKPLTLWIELKNNNTIQGDFIKMDNKLNTVLENAIFTIWQPTKRTNKGTINFTKTLNLKSIHILGRFIKYISITPTTINYKTNQHSVTKLINDSKRLQLKQKMEQNKRRKTKVKKPPKEIIVSDLIIKK
ncbi:hypothetical protein ABK040_009095 [Willaertia magna]